MYQNVQIDGPSTLSSAGRLVSNNSALHFCYLQPLLIIHHHLPLYSLQNLILPPHPPHNSLNIVNSVGTPGDGEGAMA